MLTHLKDKATTFEHTSNAKEHRGFKPCYEANNAFLT
jgi:hypothetical protein